MKLDITEKYSNTKGIDTNQYIKEKMVFQRSPKGTTIFRFNNLGKALDEKTTTVGDKEVTYLLYDGFFVEFNGKKMHPSKHIIELPVKSCMNKIGSLIVENNLDLSKPITLKFDISKNHKRYDITYLSLSY